MTFYGETLNGSYPVMTKELLSGRGIKRVSKDATYMLEHKSKLHKNLFKYWITPAAFNKLSKNINIEKSYNL